MKSFLDFRLDEAIDKEHQYKVHTRSIYRSPEWSHHEGDTYNSLDMAKRVVSNMKKGASSGTEHKITRVPRTKLAGPSKKLPESFEEVELDESSRAETGELFKSLLNRASAASDAGNHTQAKRHLATAKIARYGILAKHIPKHTANFAKYKELSHSYTNSDEHVREETLDEISQETKASYVTKATTDVANRRDKEKNALSDNGKKRQHYPEFKAHVKKTDDRENMAANLKNAVMPGYTKEEVDESLTKSHIEQHLADKDINASVNGNIVKVHSSNVSAARKHLAKAGYKRIVIGGLNESKAHDTIRAKLDSINHKTESKSPAQKKAEAEKLAKEKAIKEAINTVKTSANGKVIAWSHEGDWEKSSAKKQGTGKAANLAGKALQKTKQLATDLKEKRGLWDNIHAKQKRIKNGSGEHMRKPGSKGAPSAEDLKNSQVKEDINESAWGNDKMTSLRQAHDRHMEKALAANKAGDDEATKVHQRKMQMIQGKMQKLKNNEEVELGEECEILLGEAAHTDVAAVKSKYKENESNNRHTENAELLAKHFGSKYDQNNVAKAKAYRDKHKGYGNDLLSRHHAKLADDVHSKLYHHISEEVEELEETSDALAASAYARKIADNNRKYKNAVKAQQRRANDRKLAAQNKPTDSNPQNEEYDPLDESFMKSHSMDMTGHGNAVAAHRVATEIAKENGGKLEKVNSLHHNIDFGGGHSASIKTMDNGKKITTHVVHRHEYGFKEEVESIDELSKTTLGSYIKKASEQGKKAAVGANQSAVGAAYALNKGDPNLHDLHVDNYKYSKNLEKKRAAGISKAVDKLTKEEVEEFMQTEDYDQLDELSKTTLGSYVKKAAFDAANNASKSSDAGNKFAPLQKSLKRISGVNKAVDKLTKEDTMDNSKKITTHIVHRHEYGFKEEVESIDELSKGTLGSYVKKAQADKDDSVNRYNAHDIDAQGNKIRDKDRSPARRATDNLLFKRSDKRFAGISKAVDKLTKEDTMLTYSEFIAQLAESRADDLRDKLAADREARLDNLDFSKEKTSKKSPIKKVSGHSYGAGEEGDTEKHEPVEPAEKKGRGRPAGSKSGARI